MEKLINQLNAATKEERLEALRELKTLIDSGKLPTPERLNYVNNHIHTTYSFSPYSPTKAVWQAYNAGLCTAGIVDHDSIGGAEEFIEAGKIVGLPTTIGIETRVCMKETSLNGKTINNPDQKSNAYILMHGVPHSQIGYIQDFFAPLRENRNKRNRKMTDNINGLLASTGISLDFDEDIVPLSMYHCGGSITERHITFALAKKVIGKVGKGENLIDFLTTTMGINVPKNLVERLADENNPFLEYDLLGLFKSEYVPKFFIEATDEMPTVKEFVELGERTGAIVAYTYLGDVGQSVTGDKKAQKFEDDYLDELFDVINDLGINALAYMPSRNTMEQLERLRGLCEKNGKMQISGEDINQPRQKFICEALNNPVFANLTESTYALIGHEIMTEQGIDKGIFRPESIKAIPDLDERIKYYGKVALDRINK